MVGREFSFSIFTHLEAVPVHFLDEQESDNVASNFGDFYFHLSATDVIPEVCPGRREVFYVRARDAFVVLRLDYDDVSREHYNRVVIVGQIFLPVVIRLKDVGFRIFPVHCRRVIGKAKHSEGEDQKKNH